MGQDERRRTAVRARPDRYAQVAGRWVRWAWGAAPPRSPVVSHSLIRSVQDEIFTRGRRRRVARWTVRAALPTAVLAGLLFVTIGTRDREPWLALTEASSDPRGFVLLEGEVEDASLRSGMSVETGARLVAPEGQRIRFGTADGTNLTIAPRSALSVVETQATKRFALLRGAIHVHVRKLRPGERFIVDTSDVQIEVRGTTFEVALARQPPPCGAATLTRVSVWEGVVVVRGPSGENEVRTGEEWPPLCPPTAAVPAPPVEPNSRPASASGLRRPPQRPRAGHPSRVAVLPSMDRAATTDAPRTDLEAQNDLFAAAVRAQRGGDGGQALRLFDRFIRSYPNAGLLESAYVRRMRVLAASDPHAAAAAAAHYLERFPDGFARAEAQSLRSAAGRP